MVSKAPTLDRRVLARRCVACGYDGALLQGGLAPRCARCGCNLRKRPARSYAEMEGLVSPRPEAAARRAGVEQRVAHKWFVFLFVSALVVLTVVYLLTVALDV